MEDAALAWPLVGTCGRVWPKASSPGAAVAVMKGFSEMGCEFMAESYGGCSQLFTLLPCVTWSGDVLLRVITVSALGCQLLFPEHLERV